uniref:Uncharacterized protein n=1 Tax=Romanomermis culicivorax TaxID=13658 RepID=A0A915HGH6_ROMCU
MKSVNQGNVPKNFHLIPGHKALVTNLNPERLTPTALTDLQAVTAPALGNPQAFGATLTSPAPTIPKIASGSRDKMLNTPICKIPTVQLTPLSRRKPIFGSILTTSVAKEIGDHATEHCPIEVQITPAAQGIIFMKVIQ